MQKDNILFIFTDQWRADCVGFHGNKIVKTPNLDNLAPVSYTHLTLPTKRIV